MPEAVIVATARTPIGRAFKGSFVDERADAKQRAALETVALGKETAPGSLIWQVFSTTFTKTLPTLFKKLDVNNYV